MFSYNTKVCLCACMCVGFFICICFEPRVQRELWLWLMGFLAGIGYTLYVFWEQLK